MRSQRQIDEGTIEIVAEIVVDCELVFSGEVCPYTVVKSKLALEELDVGQVLRVTVDNSESASNAPKGLSLEGHEILDLDRPVRGKWAISVKNAG